MMRRCMALGVAMCMLTCMPMEAFAVENSLGTDTSVATQNEISQEQRAQLEQQYEPIQKRIEEENIPISITVDDFIEEYAYGQDVYGTVEEYVSRYNALIDEAAANVEVGEPEDGASDEDVIEGEESSNQGASPEWYYNTGEKLPRSVAYNRNIIPAVEKGDIVYEAQGGLGVTGHIAIVEGKYYSAEKKQYYVRLIEAIQQGVCRSVLVDQRVVDKTVTVYRVTGASNAQKNAAVSFCRSQLGKKYHCDFSHDTSASEKDWYCSELVWAAYKNQGIDIETKGSVNEPGVTPRDIARASNHTTCPINGAKPENSLKDISNHWAKDQIRYVVGNGLMSGVSSTAFEPNTAMTRAMIVTVLYRMENEPNAAKNVFSDVPNGMWYTDAISWAHRNNIVSGYSSDKFGPNDPVTREQAAVIMYRYAKMRNYNTAYTDSSLNKFSDKGSISSYAVTAMKWATSRGVMTGTSSTTIAPKTNITRAQTATMLKNFLEKTAR